MKTLTRLISLVLMSTAVLAHADTHPADLQGHFLDKDILRARPTATAASLMHASPVLSGASVFGQVNMEKTGNYEIRSASTSSMDGSLVVVQSHDGSFVALIDTPYQQGTVVGTSDGSQTFIEAPSNDYMQNDAAPGQEPFLPFAAQAKTADTDASGANVIDLLAGFSKSAAARVRDPMAYALAQVEGVNLRLRNSQVSNARLRLVGIQIIDEDFPVNTGKGGTLGRVPTLFAEGMKQYGADLVAAFSNSGPGNTAEGWAVVPGRYSVQHVRSSGAFRHEVAHNVGGSHCNGGTNNYKFGYNNGKSATALCGNKVAYDSTPLLTDGHGLPLGDSVKADMARLWRERAAAMSSYAKAIVPIED
jgi:chitinase